MEHIISRAVQEMKAKKHETTASLSPGAATEPIPPPEKKKKNMDVNPRPSDLQTKTLTAQPKPNIQLAMVKWDS